MSFLRIRRFLGFKSHDPEITRLSTKAHFVADELLERRIRAARDLVGLIEEQPPTNKKPGETESVPVDYDRLPP